MNRPVLALVAICCNHSGKYLIWQGPHGNPCIHGVLVTDRHVVVHVLHCYGHRCHGAEGPLGAAVSGHGPESKLSSVLPVQSSGGTDHSCESVHGESPLAAVLGQRVGHVPVGPLVRIESADLQDLGSDR